MLIPLHERSHAGIFSSIFIDIGDEQSIEDDLSTYSSHLTNMKIMMKSCNERSLILIDEFGGGTEPQIGGAIAEAVLKRFNQKGTLSVPSYPGILNVSSLPIAQETTNTRTKRIRPINDFIALTGLSFNAEPNWNIAAITVAATASPNSAYIKYSNASVLAGCHISGSTPDNAAAPVASPPK